MPILAVANHLNDFTSADGTTVTTAGTFDNLYVPNSVRGNATTSIFALAAASAQPTIWFHFREVVPGGGTSTGTNAMVTILDAAGNTLFTLTKTVSTGNTLAPVALGTTNVTGTTITHTATANTATTWDFGVTVSGTTTTVAIYINGALNQTVTNTGNGGRGNPVSIQIVPGQVGYTTGAATLSEVILSTTTTVGRRLAMLTPNTAGSDTGMSGTIADIADDDPATGLTSDTAGQRHSWNPSAYGGAAKNVAAVILKGQATRGVSSTKQIAQCLKIGGTNYDGSLQAVNENTPISQQWDVNPATSAVWTTANLSALQGALKSA